MRVHMLLWNTNDEDVVAFFTMKEHGILELRFKNLGHRDERLTGEALEPEACPTIVDMTMEEAAMEFLVAEGVDVLQMSTATVTDDDRLEGVAMRVRYSGTYRPHPATEPTPAATPA
jgi:hypothetical protein